MPEPDSRPGNSREDEEPGEAPVLRSTRLPAAASAFHASTDDQQARTAELREALEALRASLEGRSAGSAATTPLAPPAPTASTPTAAPRTAPSATPPATPALTPPATPAPTQPPTETEAAPDDHPPASSGTGTRPPRSQRPLRLAVGAAFVVAAVAAMALAVVTGTRAGTGRAQVPVSRPSPPVSADAAPSASPVPPPSSGSTAGTPRSARTPAPGGPVVQPPGLATAGPGATSPGLDVTATLDPDGRHVDVYERLLLRPGLRSLVLGQAALGGLTPALRIPAGGVGDLQVELEGQTVAARATGASWRAERPDGGQIGHAVLRYRLSGVLVRPTPGPPGRFILVLRPLAAAVALAPGDPVVVRMHDIRAGTMTCPTSRHHPLCGSISGRTRTAVLPEDATGVVLVQVDRG